MSIVLLVLDKGEEREKHHWISVLFEVHFWECQPPSDKPNMQENLLSTRRVINPLQINC